MDNYGRFSKIRFYREIRENYKRIMGEISGSQSVDIPDQDLILNNEDEIILENEAPDPVVAESDEYEISTDEDVPEDYYHDIREMLPLADETELECFENNLRDSVFRARSVSP